MPNGGLHRPLGGKMIEYILLGFLLGGLFRILQHPFPRFFYGELPRIIIDKYFGTSYQHEYLYRVDEEYRQNIGATPGFDGWTGEGPL